MVTPSRLTSRLVTGICAMLLAAVLILYTAWRNAPVNYEAACAQPFGTTVAVEGYLYPDFRFAGVDAPLIAGDICQGATCQINLFSRPFNEGERLHIEFERPIDRYSIRTPFNNAYSGAFVGVHGELQLPMRVENATCLRPETKLRVTGILSQSANGTCKISPVQKFAVAEPWIKQECIM